MNVRSSAGQITGQVVADLLTPGQSVAGDLSVRHLDLAPILNDPRQKTDLTADAHVDIRGETLSNINALRGTLTLDSPRLVAAGYTTGPVHAKARIDGRQRRARRQRRGVRRRGHRRRHGDACRTRRRTRRRSRSPSTCAAWRATSICASCRAT